MRVGVGSLIWVDTDEPQPDGAMEVVAVFEDFPDNSLLGECEVVKNLGETNLYTTSEWSFNYFVKFRPGADPDEFAPVDECEPGDAARGGRETCGGRGRRR